jgi:tetratricopeptide (TPR) repeat protein
MARAGAEAANDRGRAGAQAGDAAAAIAAYTEAIALAPTVAKYHGNRAQMHLTHSHDFAAAAEDAEVAVGIEPTNGKFAFRLASAYAGLEQHERALDAIEVFMHRHSDAADGALLDTIHALRWRCELASAVQFPHRPSANSRTESVDARAVDIGLELLAFSARTGVTPLTGPESVAKFSLACDILNGFVKGYAPSLLSDGGPVVTVNRMGMLQVDVVICQLWHLACDVVPDSGDSPRDAANRRDVAIAMQHRVWYPSANGDFVSAYGYDGHVRRRLAELQAGAADPRSTGWRAWLVFSPAAAYVGRYGTPGRAKNMLCMAWTNVGTLTWSDLPSEEQSCYRSLADAFLEARDDGVRHSSDAMADARAFAAAVLGHVVEPHDIGARFLVTVAQKISAR